MIARLPIDPSTAPRSDSAAPAVRRRRDRPLAGAAALAALLGACSVPPLEREPWHPLRERSIAVVARPALFDDYELTGEFVADTPAAGILTATDTGDVLGNFGLVAGAEWNLSDRWSIGSGVEQRRYVVRDLNPIQELDIKVDDVESLNLYAALRHRFAPFASNPRLRAYAQVVLAWYSSTDIGFDVVTPIPDEPPIRIDSEGEPFWLGGLGAGLLYQWSDRVVFELGTLYERSLTPLEADLTVEFGPGGPGFSIPFDAELEPEGWIVFAGVSYTF